MEILVTGSSGMLGKEVVRELKKKKHQVKEYDLDKGKSVLNEKQLEKELEGVQTIIHLAGIVDEGNKELWKINVEGTRKVVQAAEKKKVDKLVFVSSTAVYGETKRKTNEKTPVQPENEYGKSKGEGEKIVLGASKKIEACIIRSAMIFGKNEYWKKMLKMLEKNYPLPCSGKNTYQIIYSKELARAIITVMEKGKNGEIYLAAGKEKPTLNEFIEIIRGELGIKRKIKHVPVIIGILAGKILGIKLLTKENIKHLSKERNYDTKKIEKLGWKQKITLKEAVKETVKEIKKK